MGKACCVCSSSRQNCKNCECAKKGNPCVNCRKGPDCKNTLGNSEGKNERTERKTRGISKGNGTRSGTMNEPTDIQNVEGDGNCFFRCIALALYKSEEQHEIIRKKVVHEIENDSDYYKKYIDKEIKTHVNDMSRSNGGTATWATEAEIVGTTACYNIDIFVLTDAGNQPDWHLYTKDWICQHTRKYIKILCTGSHYKLVLDPGRPCKCAVSSQSSRTTSPTPNEVSHLHLHHTGHIGDEDEQVLNTSTHLVQESRCNPQITEARDNLVRWYGMQLHEAEEWVNDVYKEVAFWNSDNLFEPPQCGSTKQMIRLFTGLMNDYTNNAPHSRFALTMLLIASRKGWPF